MLCFVQGGRSFCAPGQQLPVYNLPKIVYNIREKRPNPRPDARHFAARERNPYEIG